MKKTLIFLASTAGIILSGAGAAQAQYEACVGAKAYQKAGYCKYEYEAYLTRGSCVARGGGWVDGASITLNIRAPGHLEHSKSGTTYVNFDDRIVPQGGCYSAKAGVTIRYNGKTYTNSASNRRSYEPGR